MTLLPFRFGVLLFAAVATLAFQAERVQAQPPLAITNTTVLPMTGEAALEQYTVIVRNGQIRSIGPATEVKVPKRARVIDGSGKFLLPGLIDAHVHINRSAADTRTLLDLFLAHGVTTVINLDGSKRVVELRDRIANGDEVGPTIVTSGPILRGSASTSDELARRLVKGQIEAGYDLIKVYNPLSEAGYHATIDEARKAGLPVAGHAVRSVGVAGALEAGQHIVHMEEMVYGYFNWNPPSPETLPKDIVERLDVLLDETEIAELAKRVREAGIFVTPNLVAYKGIVEQTEDLSAVLAKEGVESMPASMQRSWQPSTNNYVNRDNQTRFARAVKRTYPFLEQLTQAFHQAGVPLLAGTDVGIPVVVAGISMHHELELLVGAGLTPQAALEIATRSAADFLNRKDLGRIEEGAKADLLLLAGDPRENIRNTRTIETVVLSGEVLDLAALTKKPTP